MKSLTVWHGHSTRPSLPAGTARKASGHLSGRRPLHLANARPFGRLKAPLGLSLLRCAAQTRACLWQAEQAHHANNEKQEVPTCWVSVKQFSKNDTATACQDWLRSTRLGRGSIKSHVRTVKVLGMGLLHSGTYTPLKGVHTRLCTKVVCQGCCAPLESLLTSPVGDVDSPDRKLSQKAHPAVCGEEKALLRKCNNPL